MTHLTLHHVVHVTAESTDTDLLDALADVLPADNHPAVGPEYDGPNRLTSDAAPDLPDGTERLTARVSYVAGAVEVENDDGTTTTYDGAEEASTLYAALADMDLSGAEYDLRHYRSPVGAVTTADVQAFYEENPDLQPTDADGEPFVPTSFDPSRHVVAEESGN